MGQEAKESIQSHRNPKHLCDLGVLVRHLCPVHGAMTDVAATEALAAEHDHCMSWWMLVDIRNGPVKDDDGDGGDDVNHKSDDDYDKVVVVENGRETHWLSILEVSTASSSSFTAGGCGSDCVGEASCLRPGKEALKSL